VTILFKLDYAIKVATENDKSVLGSMKNEYEAASKIHSLHSIEYLYFNEYGVNDFPCFISVREPLKSKL
jgi:hypothetical protein